MRKISIILLWWSRTDEIEKMSIECLESVLNNTLYPEYDVIIVENKCLENPNCCPSKYLQNLKHPKVKVYPQTENLGFIRGNNVGIDLAGNNDVLLLNNDTLVPKGWLAPMMVSLNSHPDCALMMPVQIHRGSKEYMALEGNLDEIMKLMEGTIAKFAGRPQDKKMVSGNWLPLCATIMTRLAINKVGKIDEALGLGGFDDIDYSWRCLDEGLNLYLVGGSRIFHHYGQSFHFHEGLAEKWVDYGNYVKKKHGATQSGDNAMYRIKDKDEHWFRQNIHQLKPEDIIKFEEIYGKKDD